MPQKSPIGGLRISAVEFPPQSETLDSIGDRNSLPTVETFSLTENDTGTPITRELGLDLSGYQGVKLKIGYRPHPVILDAVIEDEDEGSVAFPCFGKVYGTL